VQLAGWPDAPLADDHREEADRLIADYAVVLTVRDEVMKALEEERGAKRIGKSQEALVELVVEPGAVFDTLTARGEASLAEMFMVFGVRLSIAPAQADAGGESAVTSVTVLPAEGEKCPRCWNWRGDIGADPDHPELCGRCASVLAAG
jgi:isoleucyl-tRNA synthetase